jgi:hypothetical protein
MTTQVSPAAESTRADAPGSPDSVAAPAERASVLAWAGLAVAMSLGALVFWLFEALPFQDLPAHAGLIAMRHRFAESPFDQHFFVLAPHIGPYSLFRFLGELLVRVASPVTAVRVIATLPAIATPLALLFARRRLHDDRSPTYGFLGVALSFGIMTLFGFASYQLGMAIMLFGLTLWLELMVAADDGLGPRANRKEIAFACFAPLMFVAHGHAFLLFLGLAGVACVATGRRIERLKRLRALVPAIALAAWVAWIERAGTTPVGSVPLPKDLTPKFQGVFDKLTLLITPTLMTRSGIDFTLCVLLWVLVVAAAVATIRSLRVPIVSFTRGPYPAAPASRPSAADLDDLRSQKHSRALYAGAAMILLVFLALPHAIGWFGFVDGRLVPLILFLGLMAIRRPALGRTLRVAIEWTAPAIAIAIPALALVASQRFQTEARGYKEVLARVPTNARLLNLPLDPNSDIFTAHPFVHYDKLVMAERPILVSDVWFHQGSALYPRAENPAIRLPPTYSESDLHFIDWPAYRLDEWDYALIRTRPESPAPQVPEQLTLVEHRGGWWLFKMPSVER